MSWFSERIEHQNRAVARYEAAKRRNSILTGHNQRSSRGEYPVMRGHLLDDRLTLARLYRDMGWKR